MKKAYYLLAVLALVTTVTVGCKKTPYEPEPIVPSVLIASTGSEYTQTRVNLDQSDGGSSDIYVTWRNKGADDVDMITVYDDGGDKVGDFTYGGTDGQKSGEFTGDVELEDGEIYTAVYPASTALTLTARKAEALDFAEQTQASQIAIINDAVRMKTEFEYDAKGTTITFENEMAIVSIDIAGQPNNKPQTLTFSNGAEDEYVINYSADAVSANSAIRTYIAVHPVSSTGERTLNFRLVYTNGLDWEFETTTSEAYDVGMLYTMPVEKSQILYIATAEELAAFRDDVNAGHDYEGRTVILTDDITLSGEWTPIGPKHDVNFAGTFDGGNCTISGLTITDATTAYQGLFGYVSGATIKNLKISNPQISLSNSYAAALTAFAGNTTIENCAVVGGSVSGSGNVAGIVGSINSGQVTNCYNTARITGTINTIGGIIGNNSGAAVTSCYNTGAISGVQYVGGITGYNIAGSSVQTSYNTGTVSGTSDVGGISGYSLWGSNITSSYNVGEVTGEDYIGGVLGTLHASDGGEVSNCAYLNRTADVAIGNYSGNATETQVTNTVMVKTIQRLNDLVGAADGLPSADFTKGNPTTDHLPQLMGENLPWKDPYISISINDEEAFKSFRDAVNNGDTHEGITVILDDNLTLSGEWEPIGSSQENAFWGTFDGGHNKISGLTITSPSSHQHALFGFTNGATIKNVVMDSPQISSIYYAATTLVASAKNSIIEYCSVLGGTVNAGGYTGGLIGSAANSQIRFCYNSATVTSSDESGGIVGTISENSSIKSCYNIGNVTGFNKIGGIVGHAINSEVTSCYNTATINGEGDFVGGITGYNTTSSTTTCYNVGLMVGSRESVGGIAGGSYTTSSVTDCFYLKGSSSKGIGSSSGMNTVSEVISVFALNEQVGITNGLPSADFTKGNSTTDHLPQLMGENLPWDGPPHPLYISNEQQLKEFRDAVNNGDTFEGKEIIVEDDITLSGNWTPIGTKDMPFSGTFDGGSCTISGLSITSATTDYQGLFGYVHNASIKNVKVSEPEISSSANYVGVVVSYSEASTIISCAVVRGLVSGNENVGGIAGYIDSISIIFKCYNTSNVSGEGNISGIVGSSDGSVTSCYNTGAITGRYSVGGIVGISEGSTTTCYNVGKVTSINMFVGGVVGYNSSASSSVSYCFNLEGSAANGIGINAGTGNVSQVKSVQELNNKVGAYYGLSSADFTKGSPTNTHLPQLMGENIQWVFPAYK